MKNRILPTVIAAVSGGVTGLTAYFAAFGMEPVLNVPALSLFVIICSVFSAVLMHFFSMIFSLVFQSDPVKETRINGWIFAVPALSAIAIPVYIKFYSRLHSMAPSVFGNIYVPFRGFVHVNMASFFLINAAGALWLAVFFMLAIRFIINSYRSNGTADPARIFCFAFIFYLLTTSYVTFIYPPTGDEPHYLVTARSIAADFDVNLENNYTDRKEYEKFYPVFLEYKGLHTVTGKSGKGIYTTHDIGLPLLIAPFVKMGGRYPVQFFMNFVASLLCVMLYLMLLRFGVSAKNAAAAAMGACISMPLLSGASLVLTETPAALIIAYSIYVLGGKDIGKRNLLFFAGLAFLPWLHLKLAVFPVVFYAYYYYLALRGKKFNLRTELLNNVPVLLSVFMYVWFYYAVYGIIAPFGVKALHENMYSTDPSTQMNKFVPSPGHFIISGAAALFDRDYGLLPYCLFYILTLLGLVFVVMKKRFSVLVPFLLCVPYLALFLLWKDWTGSMTPARQLIPVLPALIFYGAYFMDSTSFVKTRAFKVIAALSFFVSWLLAVVPPLRYAASKDKIYSFISARAPGQLLWILPPFRDNVTAGLAVSGVYVLVIAAAYFTYTRVETKKG
jgi:hypothetical protein